jgi:hypothetical protein
VSDEKKKPRLVQCRTKIADGFTKTATCEKAPYAGTAISFRPCLQTEVADFLDDPRKYIVKGRELLAKKLTGWNVADDTGEDAAPLTPESLAEIAYPVLDWMINAVTGYAPTDEVADAKN